ncbi:unnamed protein product [Darwinula stevensoni]|uniref:PurE domain-containing protein n=1 Tax=Darwinula stevensoni TaxID=69355 RepID=A0A7R9AEZ6_9CRUS|nr:unnamed protein product [Darwinula stevensoni]CAG0901876.1 unnamed protein product [Darwinula stevensoni]
MANYEWVTQRLQGFLRPPRGQVRDYRAKMRMSPPPLQVVVVMGSASDQPAGEEIRRECECLGIPCRLRVASAHKATLEALRIAAECEGEKVVLVAVAGGSNGLGPVLSGNTALPVINCPPLSPSWGDKDVWSSLRLPSGESRVAASIRHARRPSGTHGVHPARTASIRHARRPSGVRPSIWVEEFGASWEKGFVGLKATEGELGFEWRRRMDVEENGLSCATVMRGEAAALHAATILAPGEPLLWARLQARLLRTQVALRRADAELGSS